MTLSPPSPKNPPSVAEPVGIGRKGGIIKRDKDRLLSVRDRYGAVVGLRARLTRQGERSAANLNDIALPGRVGSRDFTCQAHPSGDVDLSL